jgi:hypothetical protein
MLCGDPRRNGSINGSGIGSGVGIPRHWTRRAVWRRSRPATASRATRIKLRGALAKTKNPRRITEGAALAAAPGSALPSRASSRA